MKKVVTLKQAAEDLGYTRAFGRYWETDYFTMWSECGDGPIGTAVGNDYYNGSISSKELRDEWYKHYDESDVQK